MVVGADGHHSLVARWRRSRAIQRDAAASGQLLHLRQRPPDVWTGYEVHLRPGRGFAAWPTNDDLTVVIAGWPRSELVANRTDIEGNFLAMLELVPDFAVRFHAAARQTRFVGQSLPNFMRKPFGAGWALVGDAGYTKDFITAFGISDAFRDAELCATALDEALSGDLPFEVAMADYQSERDRRSLPFFEFTTRARPARAPAAGARADSGCGPGQPGRNGRVRARWRRGHLTGGLPVRAERTALACRGGRAGRSDATNTEAMRMREGMRWPIS